jgi:hypothetical protein
MATLRPPTAQTPKAENILKTKGRKRTFSQNEAENILKQSYLQETVGISKEHDKMTVGSDAHSRWQAAKRA